jgi:hypothetical protein
MHWWMGGMPDLESGHFECFPRPALELFVLANPEALSFRSAARNLLSCGSGRLHTDEQIPQRLIAVSE